MALTLNDILDRLRQLDEVDLVDLLGINSDMLVDRFQDLIEERIDKLELEVDWED